MPKIKIKKEDVLNDKTIDVNDNEVINKGIVNTPNIKTGDVQKVKLVKMVGGKRIAITGLIPIELATKATKTNKNIIIIEDGKE